MKNKFSEFTYANYFELKKGNQIFHEFESILYDGLKFKNKGKNKNNNSAIDKKNSCINKNNEYISKY
jgi:hypothetical protein